MSQKIALVTSGNRGLGKNTVLHIATLLSEDSRWINAQRIEASGGMFL